MAHLLRPSTATPSQPVDISTIEQQKENIQPLSTGRSASHLTSVLSFSSTPKLGSKLTLEKQRFKSLIAAVSSYEATSTWASGQDGLSLEEVSSLAEDPLDIHHQYARFIISSYPSGASANSELVPVLESSTRKFIKDERYRNDPRYLRLWNFYARNTECPEDCYRFLFARGIGDRLSTLYEEYAKVLEGVGK